MKHDLDRNEHVIADKGYTDDMCLTPDSMDSPIASELHAEFRARHETANERLKQFAVLKENFRHDISFHGICFDAVANITQLCFNHEPLFEVKF